MGSKDTAQAKYLQIGLYGKRNSGKTSLVNSLYGQYAASSRVQERPVASKPKKIRGIGPVVFMDQPDFEEIDLAMVLFHEADMLAELAWIRKFKSLKKPVVPVISRIDTLGDDGVALAKLVGEKTGLRPVRVSAMMDEGIEELTDELISNLPADYDQGSLTGGLVQAGDAVVMALPEEAAKGQLLLSHKETLHDLLEKGCTAICCKTSELQQALDNMKYQPDLIITELRDFQDACRQKPQESKLTSFSVLFAGYKGDIGYFTASAASLGSLSPQAHILLAEAHDECWPEEDLEKEALLRLLKQKLGQQLTIDTIEACDFPRDVHDYDMVIHCGAYMFNRRFVLNHGAVCRAQGVPMTNYGIAIAYLMGILDDAELPEPLEKVDF